MPADTDDKREYLDDLLDELTQDEIAGLITGIEKHIPKHRLTLVRSKENREPTREERKPQPGEEAPPAIGAFTTVTGLPDRHFPGFADAGDECVCRFWGKVSTLPRKTPVAKKQGLTGKWFVLERAADNPERHGPDLVTMRIDRFGSRRLVGGCWDEKLQRFDEAGVRQRWFDDLVWEIVSVRHAQARPCHHDAAFCNALEACGFGRVEVTGT